jgi:phosphate transport system permease protein
MTTATTFKAPAGYARRRVNNVMMMGLALAFTLAGLAILALILGTLIYKGVSALSPVVFLEDTPAPGSSGGLRNAIVGSLLMTLIGTAIGTPIGILAGTYMAEYGRHSRLATLVRFINDILLSAPSIVIGLFIYEVMARPMGHLSGIAGSVALSILVIPVVVRTTENILLLVPDQLREAAHAMGLSRAHVIRRITYKAAQAGIVTGVMLAIARISGETAPLLFSALNNSLLSFDLNHPMASLPVVIFQFALSPYEDWQKLAWAGALIITFAVLLLSILARWLSHVETGK